MGASECACKRVSSATLYHGHFFLRIVQLFLHLADTMLQLERLLCMCDLELCELLLIRADLVLLLAVDLLVVLAQALVRTVLHAHLLQLLLRAVILGLQRGILSSQELKLLLQHGEVRRGRHGDSALGGGHGCISIAAALLHSESSGCWCCDDRLCRTCHNR